MKRYDFMQNKRPFELCITAMILAGSAILIITCMRIAYVGGYQAAEIAEQRTRLHESPYVFLEESRYTGGLDR